jgi:hypothetical protein
MNSGPLLGGLAGHDAHIGARFRRQAAPAGEPVAHPAGPGIVGGEDQEIGAFICKRACDDVVFARRTPDRAPRDATRGWRRRARY